MTEYSINEVGDHQWIVFADRESVAFCASENEAVKVMTEHSVNSRLVRGARGNSRRDYHVRRQAMADHSE
jgi:hypothetical protein